MTMTTPTQHAQAAHTPVPWAVSSSVLIIAPNDPRDFPVICNTMELGGPFGFPIDEAAANAAFIVRAVNSHASLVSLRDIVSTIPQSEAGESEGANSRRVIEWAVFNAVAIRCALAETRKT